MKMEQKVTFYGQKPPTGLILRFRPARIRNVRIVEASDSSRRAENRVPTRIPLSDKSESGFDAEVIPDPPLYRHEIELFLTEFSSVSATFCSEKVSLREASSDLRNGHFLTKLNREFSAGRFSTLPYIGMKSTISSSVSHPFLPVSDQKVVP